MERERETVRVWERREDGERRGDGEKGLGRDREREKGWYIVLQYYK